jgi:hypothetical protein
MENKMKSSNVSSLLSSVLEVKTPRGRTQLRQVKLGQELQFDAWELDVPIKSGDFAGTYGDCFYRLQVANVRRQDANSIVADIFVKRMA